MAPAQRAIIGFFKGLTSLLCRVDVSPLQQVPQQGPLIVITNHVGLVEIPLLYTRLQPRPVTGFVAAVRWQNPLLRWLLDTCQAIPLHRGEADLAALRQGLKMLGNGHIVMIFPEGTRSRDGRLQQGHGGVVFLAQQSGAPVLPVVHWGTEKLADNVRRLRRTAVRIAVGKPFHFDLGGVKMNRQVRQQMADEAMVQIAQLLPHAYRGVYANVDTATQRYLRFSSHTPP